MSASQSYTINGVKVVFPCKAYPSQISMMDKVMHNDSYKNCLFYHMDFDSVLISADITTT